MTYTIYYGIKPNGKPKVGCDQDYPNRPIQQNLIDYRILEQHEDIYDASYREVELQIEIIGKRDSNVYYYEMIEKGITGGHKRVSIAHENNQSLSFGTFKGRSKGGTIVGNRNVESGHLKSIASLGGKAVGSKNGRKSMSIERQCPHCNAIIKGALYFRWHGDKCKQNPNK